MILDDNSKKTLVVNPGETVDEIKRQMTIMALEENKGNITRAAKALGISIRTLRKWVSDWNIRDLKSFCTGDRVKYTDKYGDPQESVIESVHIQGNKRYVKALLKLRGVGALVPALDCEKT